MNEITKIGFPRCMMQLVEPGHIKPRLGPLMTNGSTYIQMRLAAGWEIVDDPRNHLPGDLAKLAPTNAEHGGGDKAAPFQEMVTDGPDNKPAPTPHNGKPADSPKRRGRPPGKKNKAK